MSVGEGQDAARKGKRRRPVRLRLFQPADDPLAFFALSGALARLVSAFGLVCIALSYGGRVLLAGAAEPGWLLFVNVAGVALLLLMLLDGRSPYRERPLPRDEREQLEWLQTVRLSWHLMLAFLFFLFLANFVARSIGWQPGRTIVGDLLMLITQISLMLPRAVAAWRERPEVGKD